MFGFFSEVEGERDLFFGPVGANLDDSCGFFRDTGSGFGIE